MNSEGFEVRFEGFEVRFKRFEVRFEEVFELDFLMLKSISPAFQA